MCGFDTCWFSPFAIMNQTFQNLAHSPVALSPHGACALRSVVRSAVGSACVRVLVVCVFSERWSELPKLFVFGKNIFRFGFVMAIY